MTSHRAPRRIAATAAFMAMAFVQCPASATTPAAWKSTSYLLPQGDTTLEQIFTDFRRLMSVPVDLTESVKGPTASLGQPLAVESFLDGLSARHGLSWFVFRDRLYVSRQSEAREIRLKVANARMAEVRNYLVGIKLLDDRFTWVELASRDEVMVQGPPAYVELVRDNAGSVKAIDPVGPPPAPPPEAQQIMTFRLHYASAGDDPTSGRPGVVSLLSRLYGGFGLGAEPSLTTTAAAVLKPSMDRKRARMQLQAEGRDALTAAQSGSPDVAGAGARLARAIAEAPNGKELLTIPEDVGARHAQGRGEAPSFEADTRLNMVIVKDKPSRRPEYERIIAALDVVTEQIALDATIIELPANAMRDALAAISANASVAKSTSGMPALVVPRNVVERAFEQVSRARLKDGGAAIMTQGLVFNEDDPFSIDFADSRSTQQYSTTIWETLAHSLVPMKVDAAASDRRMAINLSGSAKYIIGHGINVKVGLSEDRASPEKSKQSFARSTAVSMSVELREDQVLVLVNSSVWGGEDMNEPRARAVLLSAQRWQSRPALPVPQVQGQGQAPQPPLQLQLQPQPQPQPQPQQPLFEPQSTQLHQPLQ